MQQTQKYREQSRQFLAQAQGELAAGDLPQASEKAWGAAAQMVKAWADQRGRPHQGHSLLWGVVAEIEEQADDPEISRLFGVASRLHENFYESNMRARPVEYGIRDMERLVEKVEALL